MVRGGENFKKRWGLHVFEAYAADDTSRITMILNKHFEEGMPVAELYYYASAYGQGLNAYNWFRIGSDVPYHSFMFSRDKAIFYGQTEFRNLILAPPYQSKYLHVQSIAPFKLLYNTVSVQSFVL